MSTLLECLKNTGSEIYHIVVHPIKSDCSYLGWEKLGETKDILAIRPDVIMKDSGTCHSEASLALEAKKKNSFELGLNQWPWDSR
jgi:hypothetical protein